MTCQLLYPEFFPKFLSSCSFLIFYAQLLYTTFSFPPLPFLFLSLISPDPPRLPNPTPTHTPTHTHTHNAHYTYTHQPQALASKTVKNTYIVDCYINTRTYQHVWTITACV